MEDKARIEEKLLDFDRDIPELVKRVDWLEDEEAKKNFVLSFCFGKVRS